ncbi:MAG TPA: Maf-like protein [Flavobacterium sp.]
MLREKLKKYNIILASGSPRRQQLLKDLAVDFEVRLKDTEEIYPDHLQSAGITDFLAHLKAAAFENELKENDILITSDTIVWHNNKALGKPKDAAEAFAMLTSLSGTTHEVISSVCFKTNTKTEIFNDCTKVTFNSLHPNEINYYIQNYQPFDKAGAYGIQEWIGAVGIARIEGSYLNVMGLPVDKVYHYLNKL